jgi:hypothetical protein
MPSKATDMVLVSWSCSFSSVIVNMSMSSTLRGLKVWGKLSRRMLSDWQEATMLSSNRHR